jgi:hypothetical protein
MPTSAIAAAMFIMLSSGFKDLKTNSWRQSLCGAELLVSPTIGSLVPDLWLLRYIALLPPALPPATNFHPPHLSAIIQVVYWLWIIYSKKYIKLIIIIAVTAPKVRPNARPFSKPSQVSSHLFFIFSWG